MIAKVQSSDCEILDITDADRDWVSAVLEQHWGSLKVVSRGRLHQADQLPGLILKELGARVGLLTYAASSNECEIVTLDALDIRRGIGTALLSEMVKRASGTSWKRLWLVTTNDNLVAQKFCQRNGWSLVNVHKDAVLESRKIKPEIPLTGINGVPITDELEYEIGTSSNDSDCYRNRS
jgi:GNAT superfamily N-acetyltransferase